ncbi:MAG: hypothetical protein U5L05_19455 [Rubrivivax sp.]|nr:hypothetical protein [Rubrivivax sp.]
MRRLTLLLSITAPLWLAGCDMLGIESTSALAAKREAEGKAIGAGCRHAARSVEQCYALNRRADKAAVFAGWRDMNDYMRENKIEAMPAEADTELAAAQADGGDADRSKPVAAKHYRQRRREPCAQGALAGTAPYCFYNDRRRAVGNPHIP